MRFLVALLLAVMISPGVSLGSEFRECHAECQIIWDRCQVECLTSEFPDDLLSEKTCTRVCTIIYEECLAQCLPTLRY